MQEQIPGTPGLAPGAPPKSPDQGDIWHTGAGDTWGGFKPTNLMKDFSFHKNSNDAAGESGPAASAASGKGSGNGLSRAQPSTDQHNTSMADRLPEANPTNATTSQTATQAAVVAQVLRQMGFAMPQISRHGPKPVHSKDLAPSDLKTFGGYG